MKIDFVEICGFRGFRDRVRIDFTPGFTIINGRNGVGKSTICDAIEFAITGEIDKYRVEKSANEGLADYLWWRGDGTPEAHQVTAGFSDPSGASFVITRTREAGADRTREQIEDMLCVDRAKPAGALQQVCRTAIIRDEWIAELSLDLTETERFDLVRAALGAIEGPDYAAKEKEVLSATESVQTKADAEYEQARTRLNQALTELAETRDRALQAGDIASAMALLKGQIADVGDDLARTISAGRAQLAERRIQLNGMGRAIEEAREIATQQARLASPEFQAAKKSTNDTIKALTAEQDELANDLTAARRSLIAEEAADAVAASLMTLLEHGGKLGLRHGHCPLCDAARTVPEFEAGLDAARRRLGTLGSGVAAARARVAELEARSAEVAARLDQARARQSDLTSQEANLLARQAAHIDLFSQYRLDFALATDPNALEAQLVAERSLLVDLERGLVALEASRAIDRVTELEAHVAALRGEADAAADRLGKAQKAASAARGIDRAVRRANAEIIDERLAIISPLLNELYQRLRPHINWRNIEYSIRGDVRRFLSLKVGDNLNPQFVFSSGQRRATGLAFLLSVHLARPWCRWKTLILDDPVQHIDDYRALNLVEVLAALRHDDRQIVCAVEDAALADLLCRRLRSTPDSPGRRFDLDFNPTGSAEIRRATEIKPMPMGALSRASGTFAAE